MRIRTINRIEELRSHGSNVPRAIFRLRRVDRKLLARCERDIPGRKGSLFMMNRWIGPAQRPIDAHGSVAGQRTTLSRMVAQ